jgi:multidrug resistance efflux pump
MRYSLLVPLILTVLSCKESNKRVKPTLGDMTESVYASVKIEPANFYQVYSSMSGILEKVLINEGDTVTEGQILAKISSSQSILNIETANIRLDLAKEKFSGNQTLLSNILQELKLNKSKLALDSINLVRQKKLWNQGIGSKAELEDKTLRYESSLNAQGLLNKQYQQSKQDLESNYKQSINALKKAKVNLEDYFVRSSIEGKVYSVNKNKGELILPQEAIATLGDNQEFIVKLSVDEMDIAKIELNQTAVITLDAYPNEVFELIITKIYPLKESKTQTFTLESKFVKAPEKLFAGLSGEANILIKQYNQVLYIPKTYLLENDKVLTDDGEVNVVVGLKNMDNVQIISGLNRATYILKPEQ